MFARHWSFVLIAALAMTAITPATGEPQLAGLRKRAEDAAKKKAEDEAKKKLEEATKKAVADSAKAKAADSSKKAEGQPAAQTEKAAPPAATGESAPASPKVWENYDFVPGSKVIVYTDFADDKVGNFSRRLKYSSGALEVVERDGVKMLRSTSRSQFLIPVGGKLPDRFTLEIDVISPPKRLGGYDLVAIEGGKALDRSEKSVEINWQTDGTVLMGGGQTMATSTVNFPEAFAAGVTGKTAHLRILMDGPYFKMYVNERRVYNIPELQFARDTVIRVFVKGGEEADEATYITGVRLAESEVDVLYDALTNKGRWATQGILFATGKSDLRPESRPVLKEIAATLKEHGDLKILIEGHTDNVGSAASNLALSDARAAAVKASLVAEFAIDAGRITTKGLGDTKPAVPNATSEGRAQNRRVEIVKQ